MEREEGMEDRETDEKKQAVKTSSEVSSRLVEKKNTLT